MRRPRYSDWVEPDVPPEPEPEKASSSYVDAPEPDPWTLLLPLFGVGPWTPDSPCPHRGPLPEGSAFVCMACHAAGKDGTAALPVDVKPLPKDPTPPPPPDKPLLPERGGRGKGKGKGKAKGKNKSKRREAA